jgi:hypothetical protein
MTTNQGNFPNKNSYIYVKLDRKVILFSFFPLELEVRKTLFLLYLNHNPCF